MDWTIEWRPSALKDFKKLDKSIQKKVIQFLNLRVIKSKNPRVFGKALSYDKYDLWSYRLENLRIICKIEEDALLILVVRVGHRKEIYD